jgi:hypothetical protein
LLDDDGGGIVMVAAARKFEAENQTPMLAAVAFQNMGSFVQLMGVDSDGYSDERNQVGSVWVSSAVLCRRAAA